VGQSRVGRSARASLAAEPRLSAGGPERCVSPDAVHGNPAPQAPILSVRAVRFGFADAPAFLGPVSLNVYPGQMWMIVGPNGAGKSTLLRLMAGLLPLGGGRVELDGASIDHVPLRVRARRIAYLPQTLPARLPQRARDIVLLGRYPHRTFGMFESARDYAVADGALQTMEVGALADRAMETLSGGEAQRVHVAAALAQEPAVMLLDEPTASLDLRHQLQIYRLLARLTTEQGLGVVVVTHDLNGAARFGSQVALMNAGRFVAVGAPADVLQPEHLDAVYGVRTRVVTIDGAPGRWVVPVEDGDGPQR